MKSSETGSGTTMKSSGTGSETQAKSSGTSSEKTKKVREQLFLVRRITRKVWRKDLKTVNLVRRKQQIIRRK